MKKIFINIKVFNATIQQQLEVESTIVEKLEPSTATPTVPSFRKLQFYYNY